MPGVWMRQSRDQIVCLCVAELSRLGVFERLRNYPENATAFSAALHVGNISAPSGPVISCVG